MKTTVPAEDVREDDRLPNGDLVASPPRVEGGYVFIEARNGNEGRAQVARSNRRWRSNLYTLAREVGEMMEVERP